MIHHVFACRSNIGDWLSAMAIQSMLGSCEVVEHLCDEPFVAETLERLARLSAADTIVIGGGGLLMDYFDPFWRGMRQVMRVTPTYVWGVGMCDVIRQPSRPHLDVLREALRHAKLCVVRDLLTRDLLPDLVEQPVACPVIAYLKPEGERARGLVHGVHSYVIGADRHKIVSSVSRAFASDTSRTYREVDHRIPKGNRAALHAMLQWYRDADLVVSSRLHGCIIGLALGKKVVAVSGDRKVESFMQMAGLTEWVWRDDAAQSLRALLSSLSEQVAPLEFLARTAEANRRVANRILASLRCEAMAAVAEELR